MANFRSVTETPKTPKTESTPKLGRPVGSKNKAKGVTQAKPKGSVYKGTFGRVPSITGIELLDGMKYRIFDSGNVGTVNVRLRLTFANGDTQIMGPASMTFLEDRDDAWRQANGKDNNRSALHVSELDDWGTSEDENMVLLVANFGERKIKKGSVATPPIVLDDDDDDDDDDE